MITPSVAEEREMTLSQRQEKLWLEDTLLPARAQANEPLSQMIDDITGLSHFNKGYKTGTRVIRASKNL